MLVATSPLAFVPFWKRIAKQLSVAPLLSVRVCRGELPEGLRLNPSSVWEEVAHFVGEHLLHASFLRLPLRLVPGSGVSPLLFRRSSMMAAGLLPSHWEVVGKTGEGICCSRWLKRFARDGLAVVEREAEGALHGCLFLSHEDDILLGSRV